jgi:hypothetical protein
MFLFRAQKGPKVHFNGAMAKMSFPRAVVKTQRATLGLSVLPACQGTAAHNYEPPARRLDEIEDFPSRCIGSKSACFRA